MKHEFVGSSNLRSAELVDGVVTVTFKDGTTTRYSGFTHEKFEDFITAPSGGRWFHANVRLHPEKHPIVTEIDPIADDAKGDPGPTLLESTVVVEERALGEVWPSPVELPPSTSVKTMTFTGETKVSSPSAAPMLPAAAAVPPAEPAKKLKAGELGRALLAKARASRRG